LHVDQFPKVVQVFVAGDKMLEFETVDETELVDGCMWLLEKLLKKPLKRPINVMRTKWLTHENFLGSYAFHSFTAKDETVEDLAKPICSENGKPVLLFAGEATDKKYMGYVNGALRSGVRAAQEIIDFYH
jgi:spermine oxidase